MNSTYSPAFLRIRTIAFALISFLGLCWVAFYSLILFMAWDVLEAQRLMIASMLVSNALSIIMFPILAILPFRPWLDGIRGIFVLTVDLGLAMLFTLKYNDGRESCSKHATSDDEAKLCRMLAEYTLGISWLGPLALLAYTMGLLYAVRSHRIEGSTSDLESTTPPTSPTTLPEMMSITPLDKIFPGISLGHRQSQSHHHSVSSTTYSSKTSSGRMSKQLPGLMYY